MQRCNLCGETTWETVETVMDTRVVRCRCALMFVTPQPSRVTIEQAYGQAYYAPWEQQRDHRDRIWSERMDRVAALHPELGELLDVGCGDGAFLRIARARGWHITGTEISPQAVRSAEDVSIRGGELWEADLPGSAFDVVTCWHVIEHATDPRRLLQEMYRVLRPGGWLILATPNVEDHLFRYAYRLARGRWPTLYETDERELHLFFFSDRTLSCLVASAGFHAVSVGFDRGAAAVSGKRLVNELAYGWYRLTGWNWGMGLELVAQRPWHPDERFAPAMAWSVQHASIPVQGARP